MNKLPGNFTLKRYGLNVRLVDEQDADFILKLRCDKTLRRYIHETNPSVQRQLEWIRSYKKRECKGEEYYFVFQIEGIPVGVYRLYNISGDSFTCGSWVFSRKSPIGAGILGCIISRELAYEELSLNRCFTDVNKDNISSLQFQMSFNPIILREEGGMVYFEHIKENFYKVKPIYISRCINLLKSNIR